jgi:riboflavin synthase
MRIGVADTTFARADMARWAIEELKGAQVVRYTVPGMKDLAVACKRLIEEDGCEVCIALGWVGKEEIDEKCAHEANLALQQAELMASRHILKVFVHEREAKLEKDLLALAQSRVREHAKNALLLLKGKTALTPRAGSGRRQGGKDAKVLR